MSGEESKGTSLSEVPSKRSFKNKELFDISKPILMHNPCDLHVIDTGTPPYTRNHSLIQSLLHVL